MSKKKFVLLSDHLNSGFDTNEALDDLRNDVLLARGKYIDDRIQADIDNGILAVDAITGAYNPPPVKIPYQAWFTYEYDPDNNILKEQHEAGVMVGFSCYYDIEILSRVDAKTRNHAPRGRGDNDWWEAVQRYVSYIYHHQSQFGLSNWDGLSSRGLWDFLKKIKENVRRLEDEELNYDLGSCNLKVTQNMFDEIEDLTECIQAIEPKMKENSDGGMIFSGDDVLKFRPKTNKSKDSITFEHFENKVNQYLKKPESFFTKMELEKLSPERGGDSNE